MLVIKPANSKEINEWLKLLITISSAAVMALLFKAELGMLTLFVKLSGVSFLVSMILFIAAFAGVIEHRDSSTEDVRWLTQFGIIGGFTFFLVAFGLIVFDQFN